MLVWLGIILFVLWILGFAVFHIAGFFIHILLLAAVIAAVMWLVRRVAK